MVAPVPKTKYEEFSEELDGIENLPREQAMDRLAFFSKKLFGACQKNQIVGFEQLLLKARFASLMSDVDKLCSLTPGILSLGGGEGPWIQFNNLAFLGRLSDAYCLVKELSPEGLELTGASWLALIHAIAGNNSASMDSLSYISRAYSKCEQEYPQQFAMAQTAHTIVYVSEQLGESFDLTRTIQNAVDKAIPAEMLQVHGISYKSGTMSCPDGEEVLIELVIMPTESSEHNLGEIARHFSRVIQSELPDDLTDKIMVSLSFMDELQ